MTSAWRDQERELEIVERLNSRKTLERCGFAAI
jgi:hypothetical protein